MKSIIKFLLFIFYTTIVFFLPNKLILCFFLLNLFLIIIAKISFKKVISKSLIVIPFIIFTFIINCFLDNIINAIWVAIKLFLVCNITIIYSETTTITGLAETIKTLCSPLKLFKINTDEIKIMVSISLSIFPIIKKDLSEIKEACIAKGISFNIKNMKIILSKFFLSLIFKVNQLEESLIAKGYESE